MVTLDHEGRMAAVGLAVELAQGQPHVERGRDRLAVGSQALYGADDLGVQPESQR